MWRSSGGVGTVLIESGAGEMVPLDVAPSPRADGPPLPRPSMVEDELGGIVSAICARFPNHPRVEVEAMVSQAYRHLAARATVKCHLIPLTLNRGLRLMRDSADNSGGGLPGDADEPGNRAAVTGGRPPRGLRS